MSEAIQHAAKVTLAESAAWHPALPRPEIAWAVERHRGSFAFLDDDRDLPAEFLEVLHDNERLILQPRRHHVQPLPGPGQPVDRGGPDRHGPVWRLGDVDQSVLLVLLPVLAVVQPALFRLLALARVPGGP